MLRVGIAGLGLVGSALARRAIAHGATVTGFDVDPARVDALAADGVAPARDLDDLARASDAVIVCVFDGAQLAQVVARLIAAPQSPRVVASAVTADPASVEDAARRLADAGIDFIDAPFSGSSVQIERGEATLLLGATGTTMIIWQPLVALLSDRRQHVGDPGMATRAKLATNLVLGLNRAVLAEGLVFAERLGIAPAAFLELVLATPARSDAALAKGARMVQGDFTPQSRIHQHLKDVQLMLAGAEAAGQQLPLTETHAALLRAAVAAGDGDLDNAAIVQQLRRLRRLRRETR